MCSDWMMCHTFALITSSLGNVGVSTHMITRSTVSIHREWLYSLIVVDSAPDIRGKGRDK